MKKISLLIFTMLVAASTAFAQSKTKHRYLKPSDSKKVISVIIDGKAKDYYFLSSTRPSVIKVSGPGKLRLLTRGQFVPGQAVKMKYEIICIVDGGEPKLSKATNITRSIQASYLDGTMGVPGQLQEFEFDLSPGQHNISFKLGQGKLPVCARYAFTPAKSKKQDWIAINPVNPSELVELVSKESMISYYRFSPEIPLKTVLNGPVELQVLTRAEFRDDMRGVIHYRVQVKLDNKIINTFQLSSKRSETAAYKSNKQLVPGIGSEFVINVPKGKHTIELIPLDKDKNAILGRLMIPAKSVKSGK